MTGKPSLSDRAPRFRLPPRTVNFANWSNQKLNCKLEINWSGDQFRFFWVTSTTWEQLSSESKGTQQVLRSGRLTFRASLRAPRICGSGEPKCSQNRVKIDFPHIIFCFVNLCMVFQRNNWMVTPSFFQDAEPISYKGIYLYNFLEQQHLLPEVNISVYITHKHKNVLD